MYYIGLEFKGGHDMAVFLYICKPESRGHVSDLFELWIPILALITLPALGERLTAE